MRFRVLGPVEARADDGGEPVPLPTKPRVVLAVLLLDAGRLVSLDRLTAAVWPGQPPMSARRVIRTYVSTVRQALCLSRGDKVPRLTLCGTGYRLEVAAEDLDLLVFDDLAGQGRRALRDGSAAAAGRLLNEALLLWRGDPAEDVTVDGETSASLAGLVERRLLAEEDRADAELALGHDAAVIARLRQLVAVHPLRERLRGQLMTALCRTGQRAAALITYRQLCTHLVAEVGVEPCRGLRKLYQQILAGDVLPVSAPITVAQAAATATHAAPVTPHQLPSDVCHFTGRLDELGQLDATLGASGANGRRALVITAIDGTAGVGKTALAIHWAHRVAGRFPDGQVYADLCGYAATWPADPLEVLTRFLRALGVAPERVPASLDEAAALYRSMLNGKRILIVLDNAATSGQVRPLLPGAHGCAVIVTSRGRLQGLAAREGAGRVSLAPLRPGEAAVLLGRILGPERVSAESAAVAAIAERCAFLPLALRIAAERATARPHRTLSSLAAQMAAPRDRLDVLASDDDPATSVRTVLSWSYLTLHSETARMFRLLGLQPGLDISVAAAGALAAASGIDAGKLLDTLADAHLLEESTPGRYRLHELLRVYAAETARVDET